MLQMHVLPAKLSLVYLSLSYLLKIIILTMMAADSGKD